MGKKTDYERNFPAAIHEPHELGDIDETDFSLVTLKFNDGAIWVFRGAAKLEDKYIVVYTENNGCHVLNEGCVMDIIKG
jgi:hypothetical protein